VAVVAVGLACGGDTGATATPFVAPPLPVVTTVAIVPAAPVVERGFTTTVATDVRDQFGAVMNGQAVAWTSANVAVAGVDAAGVVTGNTIGSTSITATVAGKLAIATVTVTPPAVASVVISPLAAPLGVGQSTQLVVTLRDRNGGTIGARLMAWTSSDATVASVDNAGKLLALGVGTATISATSEGIVGTATVVVTDAAGAVVPVIATVSPSVLVPGTSAIITGTGFDALATNNAVTMRGVVARITASSATQLTVTVPCLTSGSVPVQVTTNLRAGPAFAHQLAAPQRTVALGQSLVFSDVACSELPAAPAGARYIIAVFSASTNENSLVDFELGGNPATAATSPAFVPGSPLRTRELLAPGPDAQRDRAHWQMLERNRATLAEGRALMPRQPLLNRSMGATALPAVGDRRDFYYSYVAGCRDTTAKMFGRALYVGARAIIWEDTANTLRAATEPALDAYYQKLGAIFDQDQYDVIRANFGDPLRRDAATDNDGHINMVFSEKLNGSGAAAFVSSCDQYPTTTFAASNYGQLFYGSVPTTRTPNINSTSSPDGWFNFMVRTVVHEVKHIAALSARVANGANPEESWLEEGSARHAEELWVRQYLHKVPWRGNTGFGSAATNGIFCDFHPENATCNAADTLRRPGYGMRRHFNELRNKLIQPWNFSVYGDALGQSGSTFYQTSWSLIRYAIDRYATSDAEFLTALTNSSGSGIANLSALAGTSSDRLLGGWALALYADDFPGLLAPSADLQIPTWDLRGIYAGLNGDASWSGQFSSRFMLQPVPLTFGSFTSPRTGLRGGANAYFELAGSPTQPQVLTVRAIGGGNPSQNLRVAIARLQ
jgi:hypothetical protein